MTTNQYELDARVARLTEKLASLEPCTAEYWKTEEELRNAELDADGNDEESV